MMDQQAHWYVAYVHSRSEKKVAERLTKLHITHFLPLIKTVRQWSDRKKTVSVPLFNGYIFIHCTPEMLTQVRMITGVVNFIYLEGKPAIVPAKQIETIRRFLETGLPVEAAPDNFTPGEQVRITFGPLSGITGELLDMRNEKIFVLRVELINQVMLVQVPKEYLGRVSGEW